MPAASVPTAAETEPARLYQAKTAVRSLEGTVWDSADCSIDKKGPTSLSLGLTTPIVAATSSTTKLSLAAKTLPAPHMRRAPRISIFLRPMRSADVVIHSETDRKSVV